MPSATTSAVVLALASSSMLIAHVDAFFRMPCFSPTVIERADPIIMPGQTSGHLHTIHGGNGFSMNATNADLLRKSTCTSCTAKQDKSAYWTPTLYFEDQASGKFKLLKQQGGMLVYYLLRPEKAKITPYPPGFRMVAGNAAFRALRGNNPKGAPGFPPPNPRKNGGPSAPKTSVQDPQSKKYGNLPLDEVVKSQWGLGFTCLTKSGPQEGATARNYIPQGMKCDAGLRLEVTFPSCWNGKDIDSPDHQSHLRYPSNVDDGECPPGFQTRLPTMFFETIWDINPIANSKGRLVLSNGDATGYGYHGDFMNGWDQDILKRIVDECRDMSGEIGKCKPLQLQSQPEMAACKAKVEVQEELDNIAALPGCNPVQDNENPGNCDSPKMMRRSRSLRV
ncbi:hypothetical protein DFS34DRAFT_428315 [Phlyctochytrium arcticum]|nr:hypothetical protein DFS34DRAFT_428315 [Phlyctochytrium arcticum]